MNKINTLIRENRNKSFVCTHSNGTQYDFNQYIDLNQFGNDIYSGELSINDAKNEQDNIAVLINKLKNYIPTNPKKVKSTQEVLDNAQKLYNIRNDIINVFESNIFTTKQRDKKDKSEQQSDIPELESEKSEQQSKKETSD